jgi:hypothetical protein
VLHDLIASVHKNWVPIPIRAQQFIQQVIPPTYAQFLSHHPQRVLRSHKVDARDTLIGFKSAKHLAAKDRTRCSGNCNGEVHQSVAPSF